MKRDDRHKDPAEQSARKKSPRRFWRVLGTIFGVLGTLVLVVVVTAAIFYGIFMKYVDTSLRGHVEADMSEYDQKVSTELYYNDPETGEPVMYQTLFGDENRILVELEDIPRYLQDATIAIEDKRFETHHGVDWRGTLRAVVSTLSGDSIQGGSTITQQLIKNVTGDNENTVKRKVTEVYRALALEEEYDKDEILEMYLNTIYLGNQCYGVQTAADMYFDKDVSELTLAECACLISITNNPSQYDPLRSDWTREQNRNRQLDVLDAMLDQGKIDQATYDEAKAEEVQFTNGYTNLGNYNAPQEKGDKKDDVVVSTANNSYFTDEVITDVAELFVELFQLQDDPADADGYVRTAFSKAVSKVYGGGYKIYTTQNPDFQAIAEDVFENTKYVNYTDSRNEPLQAAITVVDPYTGDVLAMVGGTGAKEVDRGWNWATSARQPGSATKPVSVYAPALDDGTITAASVIDDYPVRDLPEYGAWPANSSGGYRGLSTFYRSLVSSINTCAVRTVEEYGTYRSYTYMVEKLGFTTLTENDGQQSGNMGLGGYDYGVTTEEMAAAYGAFVNDGVYTPPRTFYRVEDAEGNLVYENNKESNVAMKDSTAYIMRQTLKSVITSGTGGEARFSGMTIAGKTGTTDENRDRYFAGFSPYYSAAVWTGYRSNERFSESIGNPSAVLWRQVMKRIHEGLENKDFSKCDDLTRVSVCLDSGMLATEACTHDLRGDRTQTVQVAKDTAPTKTCTVHKMVRYCTEGKHLATEYCPESSVKEIAALDWAREILQNSKGKDITATDHQYLLSTLSGENVKKTDGKDDSDPLICPVHNKKPSILPLPGIGDDTPGPGDETPGPGDETPAPGGDEGGDGSGGGEGGPGGDDDGGEDDGDDTRGGLPGWLDKLLP